MFFGWVFYLISLGGQAPHVLRAHVGRTCGEPNGIDLTIRVLTDYYMIPPLSRYEGGGLIRHQYLVSTSTTHLQPDSAWSFAEDIQGVRAATATATAVAAAGVGPVSGSGPPSTAHALTADTATIKTSAEVTNHGKGAAGSTVLLRAVVTDDAGVVVASSSSDQVTVAQGATVVVNTSAPLSNVRLWSVKTPVLYTVTVSVLAATGGAGGGAGNGSAVLDEYSYKIGVRTLKYDTQGLHLNGDNVKVRGFCDHSNFALI